MHLFLLILHFSLVLISNQRELAPNEVHTELKDGFPVGSLLTMYVKHAGLPDYHSVMYIDLFEDFSQGKEDRLQFQLRDDYKGNRFMQSNFLSSGIWSKAMKFSGWFPENASWWRFDLYKITDSKYLPIFHGFAGHIVTMPGLDKVTSVHLWSNKQPEPNFHKSDVYMNLRLPNKAKDGSVSPKPQEVLDAMDPATVENNIKKRTEFWGLDKFSIGKKIKLSALMRSSPANTEHEDMNMAKYHATLIFMNADGTWAFGLCNKYDEMTNKVKLHLFSDNAIAAGKDQVWPSATSHWKKPMYDDCSGSSSSTDIVHVKLERPDKLTIKMRIFYKDSSPTGITCQITIPDAEATHLDGQLKVIGVQGATLLYIKA